MHDQKTKPSLLFIHGFRGNHLGLEEVVNRFKDLGYSVYCPDIPPAYNMQNENLKTLDDFTAEGYATWIANYILENKLDQPILIGHSMGSIIAAATASKYPSLINDQIFFLSPISEHTPRFIRFIIPLITFIPNKLVSFVVTKYLIGTIGKPHFKSILKITNHCAAKFTSKSDEIKAAKFSVQYAISDFNFQKTCFFIAGKEDRLNRISQTKKVAAKFHGKTTFIAKTGHLINYEIPDELFKLIYQELPK